MRDNCWKRARKQTYEKLHKHKTKEELDMSKTSNKPIEDETVSSCVHSDDEKLVTEIPIVLAGLNGNEVIAHVQKDCTHHLLEFDNIMRNPTEETNKKGITNNKKENDDIVVNDNKTISIFTKLNGVDIDLSKLKRIIYIDEFTDIKTEYDITKIELAYDGVTIHVDAGEKHRSIKIRYDRYNDTDYSMLELVTPDTLSFVRRV